MHTTHRRTSARALVLAGATVLLGTALSVPAPAAHASTAVAPAPVATAATTRSTAAPVRPTAKQRAVRLGRDAVRIAATRKGSPYSYGAAGPHRFDCSGLTRWTFRRLGKSLPHSSAAQYGRVKHLRKSQRRLGDLVFFHDGGRIYHVAIYAGHGKIWHAPFSGARVRKERIWTGSVWYGRVRLPR